MGFFTAERKCMSISERLSRVLYNRGRYNLDENFTKTMGKHQFLFGGRVRRERFGELPDESADSISFNGQDTQLYNPTTGASYGGTANTGGQDADAFLVAGNGFSVTQEPPYEQLRQEPHGQQSSGGELQPVLHQRQPDQ